MHKLIITNTIILWFIGTNLLAQVIPGETNFISSEKERTSFTISAAGKSSSLLISSGEYSGVKRALHDLQTDISKVTSFAPKILSDSDQVEKEMIIVGTIGKSQIIDKLIKTKKIKTSFVYLKSVKARKY